MLGYTWPQPPFFRTPNSPRPPPKEGGGVLLNRQYRLMAPQKKSAAGQVVSTPYVSLCLTSVQTHLEKKISRRVCHALSKKNFFSSWVCHALSKKNSFRVGFVTRSRNKISFRVGFVPAHLEKIFLKLTFDHNV